MSDENSVPQLSDAQLLAYLDGALDEERARVVEQTNRYRRRLRELAAQERQLAARLYRAICPEPLELGEYSLRRLPADRREAIDRHVEQCPHCAGEVEAVGRYLEALSDELSSGFLERVKVLIARLVSGGTEAGQGGAEAAPIFGTPALAGVRGSDEEPLLYEAGALQLSLDVQADGGRPGRRTILGLILDDETGGWQARLWQEGERVAEADVDDLGNFVLSGLEPGSYDLIIGRPNVEIHVQNLDI